MNKEYKRVELEVNVANATFHFIIANEQTYDDPYLDLGEEYIDEYNCLVWTDGAPDINEQIQIKKGNQRFYPENKEIYAIIRKRLKNHLGMLYDNPNMMYNQSNSPKLCAKVNGRPMSIKTIGIRNDYRYV